MIGSVVIRPDPTLAIVVNDVVLFLPSRPLLPSQTFDVPVRAHATYAVATFSVRCSVSPLLSFENVTVDGDRWIAEIRQLGSTEVGVAAMLRNPESASSLPVPAETILSMQIRLDPSAVGGDLASLNCTVAYLSNIFNEKVQPRDQVTPAPALIVDSNPLNNPYVGEVRVAQISPRGLFSFTRQAQIVNNAVFTSEPIYVPFTHWVVMSTGALVNATAVTCTSQSQAFQLSPSCSWVILNGSETTGAELDIVTVQYESFSSSVGLRVWYPSSGATLRATPPTLRPIAGWIAANSTGQCSQQYQRAFLSASAVFTYSQSSPQFTTSILPLVFRLLASSNPNVADIFENGTIQATSPGSSVISAGPGISPAVITVTDQLLQVSTLDTALFSGISLSTPTSPYQLVSTQLASVAVQQVFDSTGTEVFVAALAVMSDGSAMPVDAALGLIVESLDPSVVQTSSGDIFVVGRGSGQLVRVVWQTPCSNVPIVTGTAAINATVPDPIDLVANLSSPRITFAGDRSVFGGIPTAASLTVTLVFPDGLERGATTDTRTQYTVFEGGDLVALRPSDSQGVTITPNVSTSAVGVARISITYGQVPISVNVSITVVRYQGLQISASPYPPFPGSDTVVKTTLFRFAGTEQFQRAQLALCALLTDNSTAPVIPAVFQSASPALMFLGTLFLLHLLVFMRFKDVLAPIPPPWNW